MKNFTINPLPQPTRQRYADLTKDSGFKAVFGPGEDPSALITLLNTFLPEDRKVKAVAHFSDREASRLSVENGVTHIDLHCTDIYGRDFIVEMQRESHPAMYRRFVLYLSKTFSGNFKEKDIDPLTGENKSLIERYNQLPPVFLIAFTLEDYLEEELNQTDKIVSHLVMKDKFSGIEVPELLNYIIVRLHRTKKKISMDDSDLEKCCYTLKNAVFFNECPEEIKGSPYESFVNMAEIANFTIDKSKSYNARKMNEDNIQIMQEMKFQNGRAEGKAEGLAEGEAKGVLEEKKRLAKAMAAKNYPLEDIVQITGLSADEIKAM